MKLALVGSVSSSFIALAAVGVVALASTAARADDAPSVACVAGEFGDHVDQGRASGDSAAIFAAKKAVYWLDVANAGEPTQVTLVWTLDGREVQRQSLDVGRSGHWHTWGMRPLGDAKRVEVTVLDAAGHTLKTDSIGGA